MSNDYINVTKVDNGFMVYIHDLPTGALCSVYKNCEVLKMIGDIKKWAEKEIKGKK